MLPLHLPQVRVYFSSLNCKCTQSFNYMIHILERSNVPFELIDPFKETVDLSILERDGEGNIFFPQIFKFDHDQHKWGVFATLDSIVEWNDAGTLRARLTTSPQHLDATPPAIQTMLPEWSKRKGVSAYMSLIEGDSESDSACASPTEADATNATNATNAHAVETQTNTQGADVDLEHEKVRYNMLLVEHELANSRYSMLLVKHSSLETQCQQITAQHDEQTSKFESSIKRLSATNLDLQTQLDAQKRKHVDSEKALFIEKTRLESDSKALRSKISDMTKIVEQQDHDIKEYEQIVETSQGTILTQEHAKKELMTRINALEDRVTELVENAQRLALEHVAQMMQEADRLTKTHATLMIEQKGLLTSEHEVLIRKQVLQMQSQHALDTASAADQIQTLTSRVVELQQASEVLQQSLDEKTNTARELQMQLDARTKGEIEPPNDRSHESRARVDVRLDGRVEDLDSKRQLLQLCRLQNDKERILITQLSSLFLP